MKKFIVAAIVAFTIGVLLAFSLAACGCYPWGVDLFVKG